jgi:hypothetical protein
VQQGCCIRLCVRFTPEPQAAFERSFLDHDKSIILIEIDTYLNGCALKYIAGRERCRHMDAAMKGRKDRASYRRWEPHCAGRHPLKSTDMRKPLGSVNGVFIRHAQNSGQNVWVHGGPAQPSRFGRKRSE